jgi:hypothetical protein
MRNEIKPLVDAQSILRASQERMQKAAVERDSPDGERSMQKAVEIYKAWTGIVLSEDDGWRFMICLKQAREIQGEIHIDDYVDLSSYPSLLGESVQRNWVTMDEDKEECVARRPFP